MLGIIRSERVTDNFCDLQYLYKIYDLLKIELDDSWVLIIVNDQDGQLPIDINDTRKRIVIMLSDERGILPPWIDDADIVFRTLSSNKSCDYQKIFPIPTGWFGPLIGTNYIGEQPKKNLIDRDYDLFYSGKATKGERLFFYKRAQRLTKKFTGIINGTTGWMQGETYIDSDTYFSYMNNARIAFAPKAYVTPETIRYVEAFESNCITITDHPIHKKEHQLWYYEDSPAIFLRSWWFLNKKLISKLLKPEVLEEYQEQNSLYYNSKLSTRAVANYILERIDEIRI